jgi:transposase
VYVLLQPTATEVLPLINSQVHHEKAQRYIGLLDAARTAANWQELPELIRKITKHAPDRKCMVFELQQP